KKGEIKITEEKIGGKEQNSPKPEEIEKRKKQIIQEYQTKFQEIASSVANLTIEILTNLQKNGYVIQKIE
ncbi:11193_t:CDS:1, partial [Funneliformis geosporum]